MKTKNLFRVLLGALLTFGLIAASLAGPGPVPHEVFTPVKTLPEAQALPIGSRIALSCDNGDSITIVTVGKDRDYLKGFTCPTTQHLYQSSPGGSGHPEQFIYRTENGLTAHLLTYGKL